MQIKNTDVNSATATVNQALLADGSGGAAFSSLGTMAFEVSGDYLPLTGGTLTGNLTVASKLLVGSDQAVYIADQTTFLGSSFYGTGGQSISVTVANDGTALTGVGIGALLSNTTGKNNSAFGYNALQSNTSGNYNMAVGATALLQNTTGSYNVAVGDNAMGSSTSNASSVGLGWQAALNATSSNCVFIGHQSGRAAASYSPSDVVGIGFQAAYTGSGNKGVFIGYKAGFLATGANNICVGYQSGNNITTGARNLIIGHDIDAPTATGSNQMSIGNIIFGTGVNGSGTTIAGNIGIGTSSPDTRLTIKQINATTGLRVYATNGTTKFDAYTDSSLNQRLASSNNFMIDPINVNKSVQLCTNIASDVTLVKGGGGVGIGANAGTEILDVAGNIAISGTKVIGTQGAAVADATDAASAITQLNALLARCRAHGLIAT